MRHASLIWFGWKGGFADGLMPVEYGKISGKWPKMGFSTGIISLNKIFQSKLSITTKFSFVCSIRLYVGVFSGEASVMRYHVRTSRFVHHLL